MKYKSPEELASCFDYVFTGPESALSDPHVQNMNEDLITTLEWLDVIHQEFPNIPLEYWGSVPTSQIVLVSAISYNYVIVTFDVEGVETAFQYVHRKIDQSIYDKIRLTCPFDCT